MAEPAIIRQEPMDGFIRDGFKGMRRTAINQFAKPFVITEDNPDGTIEPFPEDMEKEKLDSLMDLYLGQGKFGPDPFNLRPQDEMAVMRKRLEELEAKYEGPRANPANEPYKPPAAHVDPMKVDRSCPPKETALEDLSWDELRAKAKDMGISPWKKSRAVVTALIEAREAE